MKKHRMIAFVIMLLCCLVLGACTQELPTSIKIEKMETAMEADPNFLKTVVNNQEIAYTVDAFERAKVTMTFLDTSEPDYRVTMNEKEYFIWFNKDEKATLIHADAPKKAYSIQPAKDLRKILLQEN